jgi:hypothetical protein
MPKSRRWIVVGVAVAIVGGVVGVMVALWKPEDRHSAAAPLPPQRAGVAALPTAPAAAPAAPATRRPGATSAKPGVKVSGDTELIDVCGLGKVSVPQGDWQATAGLLNAATRKTAKRWLAQMLDSNDVRARAMGLMLEAQIDNDDIGRHPMSERTRDALEQLATDTGDPAVYAIALAACDFGIRMGSGGCRQVTLNDWSALDPNNAVPWLLLAGEARRRGDVSGESADFTRAAQATRVTPYIDSFDAFAAPLLPQDATPLDEAALSLDVFSFGLSRWPPYANAALQFCSVVALQGDDTVRARCNALAELFVAHAGNLLDLGIGRALGERLGWPADRVQDLNLLRAAIQEVENEAVPQDPHAEWSCDGVSRLNAWMRERRQLGELGVGRRAVAQSGQSVAELARKQQMYLDGLMRQAQQSQ